jgi:hypothetical protein
VNWRKLARFWPVFAVFGNRRIHIFLTWPPSRNRDPTPNRNGLAVQKITNKITITSTGAGPGFPIARLPWWINMKAVCLDGPGCSSRRSNRTKAGFGVIRVSFPKPASSSPDALSVPLQIQEHTERHERLNWYSAVHSCTRYNDSLSEGDSRSSHQFWRQWVPNRAASPRSGSCKMFGEPTKFVGAQGLPCNGRLKHAKTRSSPRNASTSRFDTLASTPFSDIEQGGDPVKS